MSVGISERAVCVWCRETGLAGSGYRVTARWVLTARHVVENAQTCDVKLDGDTEYTPGSVAWHGRGNVDVAVIDLGEASELDGRDSIWAGCRWVDGKCRASGYPTFLAFEDGPEREEFVGELRPLAGIERGRIHAAGTWAGERSPKQWCGMSGAGLLSEGYLIGVITEAMFDRLLACPVSKLFEDEEFCEAFPDFRLDDTRLWPVSDRPAIRQLRPWAKRTPTLDRPPSELLLAHNEVVPFDDSLRVRELALLDEFSSDRGPGMLVFTGRGGAGKTRLMIEWCARLRERGWLAGFVESGYGDIARITEGETPRLLVVDYPEGRVRELVALCRWVHVAVPSVRLVLLARSRGPWFDELRQEVNSSLVMRAEWHELDELDDGQRRRTYRMARATFGGEAGDQIAVNPEELARDDLPLFAHMRALLRGYGDGEHDEGPADLLARVLKHERKHWAQQLVPLLGSPPGQAVLWDLDRIVGALVLFGGADGPLGSLLSWLRPQLAEREREVFATCVKRLYGRGERIMVLQPDLLGEQLVFEAISHAAEQHGKAGVDSWLSLPVDERAPPGSVGKTIVVLTRLVDRGVAAAHGWLGAFIEAGCERWIKDCVRLGDRSDPRGHELAGAVRVLGDADVGRQLYRGLPKFTIELLVLRIEVVRVLLEGTVFDESQDSQSERSRLLINYGVALLDAGWRGEAMEVTQEAVEIGRKLATASPDMFLPEFAGALNNLGNCLSSLGRRAEAMEAVQEAVEIRRKLATANPDAFLPDLAGALNNLGSCLRLLGQRAEAMKAAREAVEHYRKLTKASPDGFLPDLAMALNNLGGCLSSLGRREEAMEATLEAVEIRRKLATANPDAFLPDLARALNDLGVDLKLVGQLDGAMETLQETVEIRRKLASANPDAFLPDLATSLDALGNCLSSLDRPAEALEATLEAVAYYRKLAKAVPDVFLPDLAGALSNLGARLVLLDRLEEAVEATQEAIEYYRRLANSDAFLPGLAMALSNLGVSLSQLNWRAEAMEATLEAVEHYRQLATRNPDAFLPDLARSLGTLGWAQLKLGAPAESRDSLIEGMRVLLPFYRRLPSAHAGLMVSLASMLRATCEVGGLAVPEDLREWVERGLV